MQDRPSYNPTCYCAITLPNRAPTAEILECLTRSTVVQPCCQHSPGVIQEVQHAPGSAPHNLLEQFIDGLAKNCIKRLSPPALASLGVIYTTVFCGWSNLSGIANKRVSWLYVVNWVAWKWAPHSPSYEVGVGGHPVYSDNAILQALKAFLNRIFILIQYSLRRVHRCCKITPAFVIREGSCRGKIISHVVFATRHIYLLKYRAKVLVLRWCIFRG